MTPELCKELIQEVGPDKITHCTVGANDLVYIPTGYMFNEEVGAVCDCVGVRRVLLPKNSCDEFASINRYLTGIGESKPLMCEVLDQLVLSTTTGA